MSDAQDARTLANKILDSVATNYDPDEALVILARQLLRADETIEKLTATEPSHSATCQSQRRWPCDCKSRTT